MSTALRSTKDQIVQEILFITAKPSQASLSSRSASTSILRIIAIRYFSHSWWELLPEQFFLISVTIATLSILAQFVGLRVLLLIFTVILVPGLLIYLFDDWIFRLYRKFVSDHTLVTVVLMFSLFFLVRLSLCTRRSCL